MFNIVVVVVGPLATAVAVATIGVPRGHMQRMARVQEDPWLDDPYYDEFYYEESEDEMDDYSTKVIASSAVQWYLVGFPHPNKSSDGAGVLLP